MLVTHALLRTHYPIQGMHVVPLPIYFSFVTQQRLVLLFIYGIFQASVLGQVALSYSRASSRSRDWIHFSSLMHWQVCFLPMRHLGKLCIWIENFQRGDKVKISPDGGIFRRRKNWTHKETPRTHVHKGKFMWGYGKKAAICLPGREASEETHPADTLT